MTSKETKSNGISNGANATNCAKCKTPNSSQNGQKECCDTVQSVNKVAHKLHQLEVGQRKIIQLLTSIEKELSAKEKFCCAKHLTISSAAGSLKTVEILDIKRLKRARESGTRKKQ